MDRNIKDKILDRPRAKEFAAWEAPQPSIQEVRSKLGGPSVSDDELLMRGLRDQCFDAFPPVLERINFAAVDQRVEAARLQRGVDAVGEL